MAIKEKNREQENHSIMEKISNFIDKEFKFENAILFVISFVSLVLSILMLTNVIVINESFPILGEFPTVFSWFLLVVSALGLFLVVVPYFTPSFPELKKVDWPKGKLTLSNSLRVFIFIIFLSLAFVAFDMFIQGMMKVIGI